MLNMKKSLSAVAFAVVAATSLVASAGRGGSAAKIDAAISSRSPDAIIAELERAEHLVCGACVDSVHALLDHDDYTVRQAAAWWFAKRPAVKEKLIDMMISDLQSGDARSVRNAADFVGTVKAHRSLAALTTAYGRGLDVTARTQVARALGYLGRTANTALTQVLADSDAGVRAEAVDAWYRVSYQRGAAPVVAVLTDSDAKVRAKAAAVVGGMHEATGRAALEQLVVSDADAEVRRNAAWALGQLGDPASRTALQQASTDRSGLVRRVASAALASLR